MFTRKM